MREGRGGRVYLMHLDCHNAARLDGTLGPDPARAAHVAADVRAANVGDRVVGCGEADALRAVWPVSFWSRSHAAGVDPEVGER